MDFNPVILFILGCTFSLLVGVLLTVYFTRRHVEKAYQAGKKESEDEREKVSEELRGSFEIMRDGLVQTIKAYDAATKTVEEKLRPEGLRGVPLLSALQEEVVHIEHNEELLEVESVEEEEDSVEAAIEGEAEEVKVEEENAQEEEERKSEAAHSEVKTEQVEGEDSAVVEEEIVDALPVNGHGASPVEAK